MATIDTRPQTVDIKHYAGDTLVLRVNTSDDYSAATWSGQVRSDHADATVDATFVITPDVSGALVVLDEVDTAALNALGQTVTEGGLTFKRYTGIYDVQISENSIVNTLFRGTITIDSDITRTP